MRRVLAFAVVATCALSGFARSGLSLDDVQVDGLPLTRQLKAERGLNPATMTLRDSVSISSAEARWDRAHSGKAVMEQLGDGHSLYSLSARSYMRLEGGGAVWGGADFTTGTYRDIRWNNCLDYMRVAPYVLGDATGGDLDTRRYRFSGGYAARLRRWTLGVEARYRAEIAYRKRDPRVKTVVSDLDLIAGASLRVGSGAVIGLTGGVNVYRQNCDLDFYNPINDINTYTLTGLGTYYRRFMGNTNKNSGYESLGWSAGVQWQPAGRTGLYVHALYHGYRMEQRLRNFNNLTLGYSDNSIVSAGIAYVADVSESLTIYPSLDFQLFSRRSTENLFGTSSGASYDKIGSRSPYRHRVGRFGLSLPATLRHGRSYFTLIPGVDCHGSRESYADPRRILEVKRLTPRLALGYSGRLSALWLVETEVEASYGLTLSSDCLLEGLDESEPLGRSVVANFAMQSSDLAEVRVAAKVSRHLSCGVSLSFGVGYGVSDYRGQCHAHGATASFGATF